MLSEKTWKHIRERHPELSDYERLVRETVERPEKVLKGGHGENKAVRFVERTHLGPKYLVVVYRERGARKDIITAYFTSDPKRIKGDLVWKA